MFGGIMSTAASTFTSQRKPELLGQTVVVIGGSAGIGLETARRARAEGAKLILTGRNPESLQGAASELGVLSSSAFDATDPASLERFFRDLPATIDHVMVTAGRPHYGRLLDMDLEDARRAFDAHLLLTLRVARNAAPKVRPGGTLLFMGGTGARRPGIGLGIASTVTVALPALTANLALELAPVRVNLIAAGFVDRVAARGRTRKPPQSASRHASYSARRRAGGRRRARRTSHVQHGPHRRDLRHRWRAATHRR